MVVCWLVVGGLVQRVIMQSWLNGVISGGRNGGGSSGIVVVSGSLDGVCHAWWLLVQTGQLRWFV